MLYFEGGIKILITFQYIAKKLRGTPLCLSELYAAQLEKCHPSPHWLAGTQRAF